ncbi:PadR family transcriptional regulator [Companilactobacillus zhachilii]|jgi:Predicted transcriptional regulators|uniref:PadR family transcriptional regulator n=1 Tax=Companilactobacillus zhachilii TaxID=2304606 RepID=A0A386PPA8_9LACO|nr:PadR family transcriptional regulator [Companilactobacillus zhachilii]AYE37446.1 PadR family transcriptional regulator [Companilactobacillus zhachilii]
MARSNTLQYMILGLLTRRPMTGYDIKQTFDKEKAEFWTAPFSQIYPELNRMLKDNQINLLKTDPKNSRRKTYQLTNQGQSFFKDWLILPLSSESTTLDNDNFILRLHFLGTQQQSTINQLLELRIKTINIEIAQLELELTEVINHPEQLGRELIIKKELTNKKADVKLWKNEIKG